MFEEEQDVLVLAAVVLLEMMHVVYSGCVALLVLDNVSASLHPGAVLADSGLRFARMVLAEQFDSMVLAAVVTHYFRDVVH